MFCASTCISVVGGGSLTTVPILERSQAGDLLVRTELRQADVVAGVLAPPLCPVLPRCHQLSFEAGVIPTAGAENLRELRCFAEGHIGNKKNRLGGSSRLADFKTVAQMASHEGAGNLSQGLRQIQRKNTFCFVHDGCGKFQWCN